MPKREIFDWGFQKICHKTKDLVTSFVTSGVSGEDSDPSKNGPKEEFFLSESPNTSKVVSKVMI
jgi:hypothetical protein